MKGSFKGIRVTKRGESPRIMTAEVVGSRGVDRDRRARRCARGSGLFDTWASFTAIKSVKGDAVGRGGGACSFAFMRRNAVGALSGSVIGPPRGTQLTIQRRLRAATGATSGACPRARAARTAGSRMRAAPTASLADGVAGPSVNF